MINEATNLRRIYETQVVGQTTEGKPLLKITPKPYLCRKIRLVQKTIEQFQAVFSRCKALFVNKNRDYGTSWRILRPASLTDQLFIKARRIRTIEEKGYQKVADSVESEFIGIVNYCIMSLIQLELPSDAPIEMDGQEVQALYDRYVRETLQLLESKNDDYGEVWRDMRPSSYTDLILVKLLRIKQIEDNEGRTLVSEGLDANYKDIINYAIFALIKIDEAK